MSGALATLLEPTLSQSADTLLLLARAEAPASCLWCGSRQVEVARDTGVAEVTALADRETKSAGACAVPPDASLEETYTITCQECGSVLESTRSAPDRDRRR